MDKQHIQAIVAQIQQEEYAAPSVETEQTPPYGSVSPFEHMTKDELLQLMAFLILSNDAPVVDSTPPPQQAKVTQPLPELDDISVTPPSHKHTGRSKWVLVALALCALLIGSVGSYIVLPLLHQSVTITIVPDEQTVTLPSTLHVIPGTQEAMLIDAHFLPEITQMLTTSVQATGSYHQSATYAEGTITFYNGFPQAQLVTAGTILTTGSGLHVATNTTLTIPGAVLPTEGVATVLAHATTTGPGGNIHAYAISGACCASGVLAYNSPFSGGQDTQSYSIVTQHDISTATTSLTAQLTTSMNTKLQQMLRPEDTAFPPTCHTTSVADHNAGDQADRVTITAKESCTQAVYNQSALPQVTTPLLTAQAYKQIGEGYTLSDTPTTNVTNSAIHATTIELTTTTSGTFRYALSQQQQWQLQQDLRHVSRDQANAILARSHGINQFTIEPQVTTLPTNVEDIHVVIAQ